ncbi:HDIG domain-containing protein [candidate division WOR-3 bacterium]|nr:HDIG domain-containing protein [candidate division WOR-3 bacterium]
MKLDKSKVFTLGWRFLSILIVAVSAEIISHPPSRKSLTFIPGEVSDRTILSPIEFKVLKANESLAAESAYVRDTVTPILSKTDVYDKCMITKDSFMTFLDSCTLKSYTYDSLGNFQPPQNRERVLNEFYEWLQPRNLTKNQFDSICRTLDSRTVQNLSRSLGELIDTVVSIGISESFTQNRQKTVIVIDTDGFTQIQKPQAAILFSVDQLSDAILTYSAYRKEDTVILRNALRKIAEVNLYYDKNWTNAKIDSALRSIDPYTDIKVSKGAEVLRQNQQITKDDSIKIASLIKFVGEDDPQVISLLGKSKYRLKDILGRLISVSAVFFLSYLFLAFLCPMTWKTRSRMFLFLSIVFLTAVTTCILIKYLGPSGNELIPNFPSENFKDNLIALSPVALGGFLIALLVGPGEALISSLMLSALAGVYWGYSLNLFLALLIGSASAIVVSRKIHRRASFYTALLAMFSGMSVISTGLYLSGDLPLKALLNSLIVSFIGSTLSVFFALGLISLFERLFNIVTDMKLLELSLDNQPLLHKMARVAQGTKYHSLIVGDISEAAAKAIGANPILTRVGAYYHDIGKIENPENFIENQSMNSLNIHDSIYPSESVNLLRKHVEDGKELAQKYKLPAEIKEFIQTHHGTNVMEVFLHKASVARKPEDPEIDENQFRYKGPLPKSREATLVMLADSIEAACRSLKNPSEEDIRKKIKSIFERRISDGQLKDSELSMRDLDTVEEVFVKHMASLYHPRIQYPSDKDYGEQDKDYSAEPEKQKTDQENNT